MLFHAGTGPRSPMTSSWTIPFSDISHAAALARRDAVDTRPPVDFPFVKLGGGNVGPAAMAFHVLPLGVPTGSGRLRGLIVTRE
jgi:hypothetical protein